MCCQLMADGVITHLVIAVAWVVYLRSCTLTCMPDMNAPEMLTTIIIESPNTNLGVSPSQCALIRLAILHLTYIRPES